MVKGRFEVDRVDYVTIQGRHASFHRQSRAGGRADLDEGCGGTSQEIDGGQRYLRQSSQVANPAGAPSIGSLPSSSPGVGMLMMAAHSASSTSDMCQGVCGSSA